MDTLELLKLWKNGDKAARDEVIEKNMGLVYSIAVRFRDRGHDLEDIVQIGSIGLIKAVDNFDSRYDVKFSTYAVPVITGEIKRYIRDDGLIKVSRSIKENALQVRIAIDKIQKESTDEVTIEDLVEVTGLTREDVITAMEAMKEVKSLNEVVYSSSDIQVTVEDRIEDGTDEHSKTEDRLLLQHLIAKLDEFQKKIITLRYFEDKTQMEVAKILDTSQVQVCRIEKKILSYMKRFI